MAPSTMILSGKNSLTSTAGTGASKSASPGGSQSTGTGTGTIAQLEQARQKLDEGYAKEVRDIKAMQGITDAERNAALKSLEEKYNSARDALNQRISRLEQIAEDIAFAYGGKASDYYKSLDDTDPKVKELMDLMDHLDAYSFKDAFLLDLRRVQGGATPPPTDPHVLNAVLLAAVAALGEGGMKGQGTRNLESMGLRDVELAGESFNAGRKQLEGAGFKWVETTPDGRRIFRNPKTGAQVYYDSGGALIGDQKPHWHIADPAGNQYDRSGRPAEKGDNARHIPAN